MKILVTGASGFIGRILAESLGEHDLLLWSRSPVPAGVGIESSISDDLRNTAWWKNVELPDGLDAVIHLAEPVKVKLTDETVQSIVASHRAFLENACANAQLVVYPNTAYRYDRRVGLKNRHYLKIKTEVSRELAVRENFISPVIHPLIDSSGALARLIEVQSKLPAINPFSAFEARLPVLSEPELISFFRHQLQHSYQLRADWFGRYPAISDLTHRQGRRDFVALSRSLRWSLRPFLNVPTISILLEGRTIPVSNP